MRDWVPPLVGPPVWIIKYFQLMDLFTTVEDKRIKMDDEYIYENFESNTYGGDGGGRSDGGGTYSSILDFLLCDDKTNTTHLRIHKPFTHLENNFAQGELLQVLQSESTMSSGLNVVRLHTGENLYLPCYVEGNFKRFEMYDEDEYLVSTQPGTLQEQNVSVDNLPPLPPRKTSSQNLPARPILPHTLNNTPEILSVQQHIARINESTTDSSTTTQRKVRTRTRYSVGSFPTHGAPGHVMGPSMKRLSQPCVGSHAWY